MRADVERVRIEPGSVERLLWGVQMRSSRRGGVWCLVSAQWLGEDLAPECWPAYLMFRTRAAARACVQQLRWAHAPDADEWQAPRPPLLFRPVRVRERISVVA